VRNYPNVSQKTLAARSLDLPDPAYPAATLVWLRRDLRLDDHPALAAAIARGGAVIPVFVLDPETEALGAAHRWRLAASLADLAGRLAAMGSRLILRRGPALPVLRSLIADTGADAAVWSRLYDGAARARDGAVKAALRADGIEARSYNGALIHEPWEVTTQAGGFFKVYSPFARAARARPAPAPIDAPQAIPAPAAWPASDRLADWALGADMNRGGAVLAHATPVGEAAAVERLSAFLDHHAARYRDDRDRLDLTACSGLSAHLAMGEISPRRVWHAAAARVEMLDDARGPEHFLSELLWREFAYHLLFNTPRIEHANWREDWDAFPWRADGPEAERWRRGLTGVDIIDAAMREMYATGLMHNRARMLVASYLTKHLMTHWQVGEAWFRDTLIDWDPAANAMGWQWAAGSGPDASPFFRVFNPETQAAKFDAAHVYRRHWLAGEGARDFLAAAPRSWAMTARDRRPDPAIDLAAGRSRALASYQAMKSDGATA
jgi:deoxyribodipyrimidine photo-lyase